ncbi:MAG: hypothetical protein ACFUZC_08455 [Chthoniobacteraceae bacterium]
MKNPIRSGYMGTRLTRMADYGDTNFDPDWSLLKLPVSRNVHTEHIPANSMRHPIRESLYYALLLLERDSDGDEERAHAIIHKAISLQSFTDPSSPLYGLWNYFAEESAENCPLPDLNWADFNGMTLLMIWHLHGDRLDESTSLLIRESIYRAACCIRKRNVAMTYTNIAIKGTFVTLAAAELLGDKSLMDYAVDRARRLHAEVFKTASFSEYNSPTYAGVSLGGLMAIDNFVLHEPSRVQCREIQHRFWMHIAKHFHVPTCELAGPHSRAYSIRFTDAPLLLGTIIAKATLVDFDFSHNQHKEGFDSFYGYFLKPDLPPSARELLVNANRTATVVEVTDPRDTICSWWCPVAQPDTRDGSISIATPIPSRITTYLNPDFALGSVNLMDGWEQRQNLIGYWKNRQGRIGYLRQRYLHDNRPCCSGYFASVQQNGIVLAANFLVQYCDDHVSIPSEEITAEFLGTVIEVDNEGAPFDVWVDGHALLAGKEYNAIWQPGSHIWLRLSTVWIALRLLAHEARPSMGITPQISFNGSRLEVRLPHYHGTRKTLRWTDFEHTHTSYALWMASPQADWDQWREAVRSQQSQVGSRNQCIAELSLGKMKVSVPLKVVAREKLPSSVCFQPNADEECGI